MGAPRHHRDMVLATKLSISERNSGKMKVLIDLKNLALYSGGIAHWIQYLLVNWIDYHNAADGNEFVLVFPEAQHLKKVKMQGRSNFPIPWPIFLPRNLRHPWYDNWLFPMALKELKPQFLFSPYHDLRIPKKSNSIFTVVTVHDLCFIDVPESYPFFIRNYY